MPRAEDEDFTADVEIEWTNCSHWDWGDAVKTLLVLAIISCFVMIGIIKVTSY